jgi:hypothetical protein
LWKPLSLTEKTAGTGKSKKAAKAEKIGRSVGGIRKAERKKRGRTALDRTCG